jgi:hypothetical protein
MNRIRFLFLSHIIEQCRFAIKAKGELDRAARKLVESVGDSGLGRQGKRDLHQGLGLEIKYHQQGALVALALVSRLLGLRHDGPHLESRSALRAALKVGDSCLLKDRQVRDVFEHMDERLESVGTWDIADGKITGSDQAGATPSDFAPLSHLDIGTTEITSRDRGQNPVTIDLAAAVEEARRIAGEAVRLQNETFQAKRPLLDHPFIGFPEPSE